MPQMAALRRRCLSSLALVCAIAALAPAALAVTGNASFDGRGRLHHLIQDGAEIPVRSIISARLASGAWAGQSTAANVKLTPSADSETWTGDFPAGQTRLAFKQIARAEKGAVRLHIELTPQADLDLNSLYLQLDLTRPAFLNGSVETAGAPAVPLGPQKPAQNTFLKAESPTLTVRLPGASTSFTIAADAPHPIRITDEWRTSGRNFIAQIDFFQGALAAGATAAVDFTITTAGEADHSPAHLNLYISQRRYKLHGIGGNYCFRIDSPVTRYTLDNLNVAWARTEMSLKEWAPEKDKPSSKLRTEFELARNLQDRKIPYVISVWRIPEDLCDGPATTANGSKRRVPRDRWDDLTDRISSYLSYAKEKYGVQPDLFSFNESNIGIDLLLTAEEHRDLVKKLGASFEKLGLKTKLLLADATGPRGTHEFALAAAGDPQTMRYIGAVAFHSWGGGTPEQYAAWGDLAEWLNLPLLVTELGVDSDAWRNRTYESYDYGLQELRMYQEILLHARPQATLQWEFTPDYGIVKSTPDIQPTQRFYLVKHLANLTPRNSDALLTKSDNPNVLFTAFQSAQATTLHIANLGPSRDIVLDGLPDLDFRAVRTTEAESFVDAGRVTTANGQLRLHLPARALLTLTTMP